MEKSWAKHRNQLLAHVRVALVAHYSTQIDDGDSFGSSAQQHGLFFFPLLLLYLAIPARPVESGNRDVQRYSRYMLWDMYTKTQLRGFEKKSP